MVQKLSMQVVNRFFPDAWAVSTYLGAQYDLVEWWEPYKVT